MALMTSNSDFFLQMVRSRHCTPHQCPVLGDLPTGAAGSCVARWYASCPTPAGAKCCRKRGNQRAVFALSDAADSWYADCRVKNWFCGL